MTEPRQKTTDEVRAEFIEHLWVLIDYWHKEARTPDTREKLSGLTHSILAALDGCAAGLPGFVVAPCPHKDDAEFLRAEGENWYPRADDSEFDIAGSLHEELYAKGRR